MRVLAKVLLWWTLVSFVVSPFIAKFIFRNRNPFYARCTVVGIDLSGSEKRMDASAVVIDNMMYCQVTGLPEAIWTNVDVEYLGQVLRFQIDGLPATEDSGSIFLKGCLYID